jgi:hypothetical protein
MSVGPRKQGTITFQGMDLSMASTAQDHKTADYDQGGNHEVRGSWQTRRGFSRTNYEKLDTKVTAVATWYAANNLLACLMADQVGYYGCVPVPFPAGGYGTGGYGTQNYGS